MTTHGDCVACAEKESVLRCSQCKTAVYCSKTCQENDWYEKGHKQACIAADIDPDTIPLHASHVQLKISAIDVVVFDFDGTLVSHASGTSLDRIKTILALQGGASYLIDDFALAFIRVLVTRHGRAVGVASYGTHEVIEFILDKSFGGADERKKFIPDDQIYTPSKMGIDGWNDSYMPPARDAVVHGKFSMLHRIQHVLAKKGRPDALTRNKRVLFVDDNRNNCIATSSPEHGYSVLYTPQDRMRPQFSGFSRENIIPRGLVSTLTNTAIETADMNTLDSIFARYFFVHHEAKDTMVDAAAQFGYWRRNELRLTFTDKKAVVFDEAVLFPSPPPSMQSPGGSLPEMNPVAKSLIEALAVTLGLKIGILVRTDSTRTIAALDHAFGAQRRQQLIPDALVIAWTGAEKPSAMKKIADTLSLLSSTVVLFDSSEDYVEDIAREGLTAVFVPPVFPASIASLSVNAVSPPGQMQRTEFDPSTIMKMNAAGLDDLFRFYNRTRTELFGKVGFYWRYEYRK